MRLFIAIEISDENKEVLSQAQSRLKYAGADVKWVEKSNIHLTLKFLGEVSEAKARDIKAILDSIAGRFKPFELALGGIGAFPNTDHPRVIWAGLEKGACESAALAEDIDEDLSKIGFEKETRPFAGHITIGRVRSKKNKEALKEKMASCDLGPGTANLKQTISSMALIQSTLTPRGSIYTKIHEAKFRVQ